MLKHGFYSPRSLTLLTAVTRLWNALRAFEDFEKWNGNQEYLQLVFTNL